MLFAFAATHPSSAFRFHLSARGVSGALPQSWADLSSDCDSVVDRHPYVTVLPRTALKWLEQWAPSSVLAKVFAACLRAGCPSFFSREGGGAWLLSGVPFRTVAPVGRDHIRTTQCGVPASKIGPSIQQTLNVYKTKEQINT